MHGRVDVGVVELHDSGLHVNGVRIARIEDAVRRAIRVGRVLGVGHDCVHAVDLLRRALGDDLQGGLLGIVCTRLAVLLVSGPFQERIPYRGVGVDLRELVIEVLAQLRRFHVLVQRGHRCLQSRDGEPTSINDRRGQTEPEDRTG